MTYSDKRERSVRRPLQRSTSPAPADLDDAKTRFILEVAAKHPRFTPEEVYAEIRYGQRRSDITTDMARHVLADKN
ncbi:hypothetical protein [Actinomadura rubrisoli]|uniref:Uncharacterized protein n=1 Tax=Actinomadura rubrisoli TaxID=2530368 RepID=A0A4R5CCH2_9ACTN|nr:hypothetical protein [Actinomadura rubrisoli]TDD97691.1 hypothetical protein E1298_01250 [Actinomadura rubrisoli]